MKKVTLFAAAAALGALVASPVMAQDTARPQKGAHMKGKQQHARMQTRAMQNRQAARNRMAYRGDNWDRGDSGFGPGAVAGGIVGGAIGTAGAITAGAVNTAGAIATAPFGGPYYNNAGYYNRGPYYGDAGYPYGSRVRYGGSYASADTMGWGDPGYGGYGYAAYNYDGVAIPASPSYDARNGFTCRPGSVTKSGAICQ